MTESRGILTNSNFSNNFFDFISVSVTFLFNFFKNLISNITYRSSSSFGSGYGSFITNTIPTIAFSFPV